MGAATPEQQAQAPDQQLEQRKQVLDAVARRGIDEFQWRTLMNSLFPGARSESVLMVIDYCRTRKLDPMKKPCHIVPIKVKVASTGNYEWRDVVMAGIYEYRTTAMRTGNYLGHTKPEYGPVAEIHGVQAPEWCAMTFYRRASNGERIEFPVCVYFREACATKDGKANDRWSKAPIQMLTKCTEAAGLREAFPDEFGGETTAEEMDGRGGEFIDAEPVKTPIKPAERLSEQAAKTPAPESSQAPANPVDEASQQGQARTREMPSAGSGTVGGPSSTEKPAALNVGTITNITEHGSAFVIELNTGFKCSSKNADMKSAAANLRAAERVVELVTTQNGDPTKFMPKLDEIIPVAAV